MKRAVELGELRIRGLSDDGRGVASANGRTVLVDAALPGEAVTVRALRKRGGVLEAVALDVREPAAQRVRAPCAHFGRCGGCTLQHLAPEAQLELKQSALLGLLARVAGLAPARVLPPLTASGLSYRRKARLGVRWLGPKGIALVGFRELRGARVAFLDACATLHRSVGSRISALRELIASLQARDRIPQIEVAVGEEGAAALVFRHLDPLDEPDRQRLRAFARRHALQVYLQGGGPGSIEALEPERAPPLSYRLPQYAARIEFGPLDFTQINYDVNRVLIDRALALLALEPEDTVLDLFCGLGNFSVPLARTARSVTGVEGDDSLVERARRNAALNGASNAAFFRADLHCPDAARDWLARGWSKLLLDPPRSGALAIAENLPAPGPRRIVYVSCNPETLARDAGVLVRGHRYRLACAGIVDMFPHTPHVESIALFERAAAPAGG